MDLNKQRKGKLFIAKINEAKRKINPQNFDLTQ